MPSFYMTEMAKGADAGMQVETARPRALTDLAQRQATLEQTQQQNEIREYSLKDYRNLDSMAATPEVSESKLGEVFSTKKRMTATQEKLQALQAKRDTVKFDDKLYETYNSKVKATQDELKTMKEEQAALYKQEVLKAASPILAATDQESWNRARPLYAKSQVEAMKQIAIENGQPEPTPQELDAAYRDALKALPEKYGPSAENMKRAKGIEIEKLKDVLAIEQEERAAAKDALDAEKTRKDMQKTDVEIDKAASGGKDDLDALSKLSAFVNTQSNIINRDTPIELETLQAEKAALEEKYTGWFSDPDSTEQAEIDAVTTKIAEVEARRDQANKLLAEGQKKLELIMQVRKAKGLGDKMLPPGVKYAPGIHKDADGNKIEVFSDGSYKEL